jgi:hypothetical protein
VSVLFPPPVLAALSGAAWSDILSTLIGIVAVALLALGLQVLVRLERRVARLEDSLDRRARAEVAPPAGGAARPRADGDLSRVEGLLVDLRDAQRRLDDRILALAERASATPSPALAAAAPSLAASDPAFLLERVTNRLLAQGFEQVECITPRADVAPDGAVVVEARRAGTVHKGEVRLAGGAVVDVTLRPAHDLFP